MEQTLHRRLEIGFALVILATLVIFFLVGSTYPPRPRELPLLVDSVGILLVSLHLVNVIRRPAVPGRTVGAAWNWRAVFLCLASLVAYLVATLMIGMVLSSAIIIYGGGIAFGARNKTRLALVTLATVAVIYWLFVVMLRVPLYRGIVADFF